MGMPRAGLGAAAVLCCCIASAVPCEGSGCVCVSAALGGACREASRAVLRWACTQSQRALATGRSNATAADGQYPNFMVPVWKQRMFDRANNLTEAGIQEFLQAASAGLAYRQLARELALACGRMHSTRPHTHTHTHSLSLTHACTHARTHTHAHRLVAYQGCRIIGVLSNLEREKYGDELRERLARHGALQTITAAMGAHMVSLCVCVCVCVSVCVCTYAITLIIVTIMLTTRIHQQHTGIAAGPEHGVHRDPSYG